MYLQEQISRCRQLLDELPGGDLTFEQQNELMAFYQSKLKRKRYRTTDRADASDVA